MDRNTNGKECAVDTHCHVQFPQYNADREDVIRRALDGGVRMVCVGVDAESSRCAISLAERYEGIWASVGLHPNDNLNEHYRQSEYERLAAHPKVVAIGEVGLDYYRTTEADKCALQRERFLQQIDLAYRMHKPLIIHCRSAHEDMIKILEGARPVTAKPFYGITHSFTGTLEQAFRYRELGYLIGLNGIITFSKDYDRVIKEIPLKNMVLETDAPYLSPVPHRGERNEPLYILCVATRIAELKGIELSEVLEVTTQNASQLFGISMW